MTDNVGATPPDRVERLFERIRELHRSAGEPSTRELAKTIGAGVLSHSTVHLILKGSKLPRWGSLELVVIALRGDPLEFQQLWIAAREAVDAWSNREGPYVDLVVRPLVDDRLAAYRDEGEEHYLRGDLQQAHRSISLMTACLLRDEAYVLRFLGRLDEAHRALDHALQHQLAVVDPSNVEVLRTRAAIALNLFDRGFRPESMAEFDSVRELQRQTLMDDHPDVLSVRGSLGFVRTRSGHAVHAEFDIRDALTASVRISGEHHHRTLELRNALGANLVMQGRLQEALDLISQVIGIYRQKLNEDHPRLLLLRNNAARTLILLGRLDLAERELTQIVEASKRVLGTDNHNTLLHWNNLALVYDKQGRYVDAEREYREILDRRMRALGEKHPETLRTRNNLAFVLDEQAKLDAAIEQYRMVLNCMREVPDENDVSVMRTRGDLASALERTGQLVEAEAEYRVLLGRQRASLGESNVQTLSTWRSLIRVLGRLERFDSAAHELTEFWRAHPEPSGDDHPDEGFFGPGARSTSSHREPPVG